MKEQKARFSKGKKGPGENKAIKLLNKSLRIYKETVGQLIKGNNQDIEKC